jgi:hypothetical protein
MKRFDSVVIASFVVVAAAMAAPALNASTDVSFGVNAPVGDDGHLFFSISSRYFDRDPGVVEDWGRRFHNPDDLAVFLHICAHSSMAPDVVFRYRQRGLSWYDVGARAGVPVEVWYVGPYAQPYGQAKKHHHGSRKSVWLSDGECRDRVAVRMAHDYYGVSPEVAMDWRRDGNDVRVIMNREYRSRHDHGHRGDNGDKHRNEHDHDHGRKHDHD